jgi:hypothetical protein
VYVKRLILEEFLRCLCSGEVHDSHARASLASDIPMVSVLEGASSSVSSSSASAADGPAPPAALAPKQSYAICTLPEPSDMLKYKRFTGVMPVRVGAGSGMRIPVVELWRKA